MSSSGILGFILIVINIIVSYKGFTNQLFFEGYKFEVDKILVNKDYKRLITAGFLHVSWTHLFFNMFTLYAFSGNLEAYLGSIQFLLIYFTSLIGGHLLSLLIHKHHSDYSAVGASGAISGVVFTCIALFPGMDILIFGFAIPSWLYGIVYIAISIYGIKSKKDNIGHEAHLGGALIGMTVALILSPASFINNYITIVIIAVPTLIFIYLIITKPSLLLIDNFFVKNIQRIIQLIINTT